MTCLRTETVEYELMNSQHNNFKNLKRGIIDTNLKNGTWSILNKKYTEWSSTLTSMLRSIN